MFCCLLNVLCSFFFLILNLFWPIRMSVQQRQFFKSTLMYWLTAVVVKSKNFVPATFAFGRIHNLIFFGIGVTFRFSQCFFSFFHNWCKYWNLKRRNFWLLHFYNFRMDFFYKVSFFKSLFCARRQIQNCLRRKFLRKPEQTTIRKLHGNCASTVTLTRAQYIGHNFCLHKLTAAKSTPGSWYM